MSISERQIEERKMRQDRILIGALKVFKANGLEGATMDEIATASGFGKATLYYYFKSKEEVFSSILENGWKDIWESLEPIIAEQDTPRKTFVNVLIKIAENAQNRPGLFEFLFNRARHFCRTRNLVFIWRGPLYKRSVISAQLTTWSILRVFCS